MNFHWFHHNDHKPPDQQQLDKLAELLRAQMSDPQPVLSSEKKARIRAHLFERIGVQVSLQQELPLEVPSESPVTVGGFDETESYLIDRLISWIRTSSHSIKMSLVQKAVIRERL